MATSIVAPGGANTPVNSVTPDDEQPRNPLMPRHREVFEDGESIGQQALARSREMTIRWWSVLECLRECDSYGQDRKDSLPAWARDLIGTYAQQHAAHDEHRQWHEAAERALRLAEGDQVAVFEVWSEAGHRLDGQFAFWKDADTSRAALTGRYPGAYVCRVNPKTPIFIADDLALLDTLIGRTFWCGITFGAPGEHNLHTVQDITGRTVHVPSDVLMAHEAFGRMTETGRSRVRSHAGKVGAA